MPDEYLLAPEHLRPVVAMPLPEAAERRRFVLARLPGADWGAYVDPKDLGGFMLFLTFHCA